MASINTSLLTIVTLLLVGQADAYFRINCAKLLESRIDPVASPGVVSRYVQSFVGGSALGPNASTSDLLGSSCSTCAVSKDRSSYSTPQLYWQYSNGSFAMVPSNGSTVTYHGTGSLYTGVMQFTPFPAGLRMQSGDPTLRAYDTTDTTTARSDHASRPIADRVNWSCLGGNSDGSSIDTPGFPASLNCPGGLLARIHFQTCWNGQDLYKSDNSHVAYLSYVDSGGCPQAYPNLLPHLSIDTYWSLSGPMFTSGGKLVLSSGDATGYGYTGEFINGWDPTVLQNAVSNCLLDLNSGGTIGECPTLQSNYQANPGTSCPHKNPIVNENIYGVLSALPGCIKVTSGPSPAAASDMTCASSVTPPSLGGVTSGTPTSTSATSSVPQVGKPFGRTNWIYIGCSVDTGNPRILGSTWNYTDTSGLTIESCQTFCQTHGQKYAGVESGKTCYCGQSIAASASFSATSLCNIVCSGDPTRSCGGTALIEIFNNTAVPNPPTPSVLAKSGTYISKGCYRETAQSGNLRTLADASTTLATLTVDSCVRFCLGKNLRYAGVESGSQCYCAANLNMAATTAPLSDCNMVCAGNNNKTAQMCGGNNRLNVYYSKNVISISKRWTGRGWMPWTASEEDKVVEHFSGADWR